MWYIFRTVSRWGCMWAKLLILATAEAKRESPRSKIATLETLQLVPSCMMVDRRFWQVMLSCWLPSDSFNDLKMSDKIWLVAKYGKQFGWSHGNWHVKVMTWGYWVATIEPCIWASRNLRENAKRALLPLSYYPDVSQQKHFCIYHYRSTNIIVLTIRPEATAFIQRLALLAESWS